MKCKLGFLNCPQFGIVIDKRTCDKDIRMETQFNNTRVDLPPDVGISETGGGVHCRAEGEFIGLKITRKSAREKGNGIAMAIVVGEGGDNGGCGDQVPVGYFIKQLMGKCECAGIAVGLN